MIPYGKHRIDEEDIQAVVDVPRSSALTQGPTIERLEIGLGAVSLRNNRWWLE